MNPKNLLDITRKLEANLVSLNKTFEIIASAKSGFDEIKKDLVLLNELIQENQESIALQEILSDSKLLSLSNKLQEFEKQTNQMINDNADLIVKLDVLVGKSKNYIDIAFTDNTQLFEFIASALHLFDEEKVIFKPALIGTIDLGVIAKVNNWKLESTQVMEADLDRLDKILNLLMHNAFAKAVIESNNFKVTLNSRTQARIRANQDNLKKLEFIAREKNLALAE